MILTKSIEIQSNPGKYNYVTNRLLEKKKKYYLADNDENIDQLKQKQLEELTGVLINLKSEYDTVVRETQIVQEESEKMKKKTKILEDKERKIKAVQIEMEDNNHHILSHIEIKKVKKDEEAYKKETLLHLLEKLKEEVVHLKKDVATYEIVNDKLHKTYEKHRIEENVIKQHIDQVHSRISTQRFKNGVAKNENDLQLQYYHNILNQRWNFIKSTDERKEQQKKIAEYAKNSTQDEQEVKARKTLFFLYLYNKFLHKSMEKELRENELLEETFQQIRDITGSTNLKIMVDKIIRKDKNYNVAVAKVSEKETRKEVLSNEIKKLEVEYLELKNNSNSYLTLALTDDNQKDLNYVFKMEEEEKELVRQEQELLEELKVWQEKHKDVKLVYEKVVDNIKSLLVNEKKVEENIFNQSISDKNLNESKVLDSFSMAPEEETLKMYADVLENLKKRVDNLILNQSHEQFKDIMREKGYEPNIAKPKPRNKNDEMLMKELKNRDEIIYEKDREEDEINILRAREEIIRDYHRAKVTFKFYFRKEKDLKIRMLETQRSRIF
jgi:hypothetical protein